MGEKCHSLQIIWLAALKDMNIFVKSSKSSLQDWNKVNDDEEEEDL